ncbi:3-hydroxyacyl-CoA dehydrogenase NAD-binding domain-containing protein [Paraburkholderia sp. BL10I2N1]|uniref:3-hydroxyacyl-CoA dehydrogenase NAD-binding domain-containing protein n=1 Tax=Paraburkholderia sp. BL10I2N1 TaxID=1938796 RepID=UPI0010614FD6|nr:3-hydroxyacyl-CoA dehydrogenase NAD-binding domain-containing protein [Paraburkholderia sp. BL10I2N1]TDN61957.1 3-hydroxyacyl-CoA dehydrogenase [Paraburkholderia sp. BL10I2N1]
MDFVTYSNQDDIAIATVSNPPVNALGLGVRRGLMDAIARAAADPNVKALIIVGGGKTFVAGADINDFGKPYVEPSLYRIIDALTACRKPVIAAIHGTALGGGLELALSCHWRVAVASAKVGQPEVKLGLMPGGHGTQWWLRLAGPEAALEITTSGHPVGAPAAEDLGIIDRIVDGDLVSGAVAFAKELIASGRGKRDITALSERLRHVDSALFDGFRKKNQRKWRGLLAPWKIVDCLEASCKLTFEEGAELEKAAFQECEHSPQSKALIHLFFAEREAARILALATDVQPMTIASVAVIGAGTMGGGIAMSFAGAGLDVILVDRSEEALSRGFETIRKNYTTSVSRGSITQASADRALARIGTTSNYADIGQADLIIEAVFEDIGIKKEVFRQLDAVARAGAILATNTSTLDIDQIAAATARPERVIGMHFFSPANVMKLVEIVRGAHTSDAVIATAMAMAKKLGKIPVLAGNAEGFIGNRILAAYGREADFLLEEGATPWQIDRVLQDFGFPMGLFAMRDMAGLDVIWRIRQQQATRRTPGERYSPIADQICERGWFGQKTGRGYYRYQGREAIPDPEIEALIEAASGQLGIIRAEIPDDEVLRRLLCAMVNEGAHILDAGVAQRASDIDVVYAYGYGFPTYRGGPMFWAQQTGLDRICEAVRTYHRIHGDSWQPAASLARSAMGEKRWSQLDHRRSVNQ